MNEFRERRQESAVQIQAKRPGAREGRPEDGAKVAHVLSIRKSRSPQLWRIITRCRRHQLLPPTLLFLHRFEVNVPPVFSPFQRNSGENLIDLR
jgi:hypothetical protein